MVAISLGQSLVGAQPSDGVLNGDAAAGKGGVEGDVLGWAGLAARLPTRGRSARVQGVDADVGQVADRHRVVGQPLQQSGLFEQGQIRRGATSAGWEIDDLAGV